MRHRQILSFTELFKLLKKFKFFFCIRPRPLFLWWIEEDAERFGFSKLNNGLYNKIWLKNSWNNGLICIFKLTLGLLFSHFVCDDAVSRMNILNNFFKTIILKSKWIMKMPHFWHLDLETILVGWDYAAILLLLLWLINSVLKVIMGVHFNFWID